MAVVYLGEPIQSGYVLIPRAHLANVTSLEHERWKRADPEQRSLDIYNEVWTRYCSDLDAVEARTMTRQRIEGLLLRSSERVGPAVLSSPIAPHLVPPRVG